MAARVSRPLQASLVKEGNHPEGLVQGSVLASGALGKGGIRSM